MEDGKQKFLHEEEGYALLYALGAVLLMAIIVGAIFIVARNTYTNIDKLDQLTRVKDVEEYALQDMSTSIKSNLEQGLSSYSGELESSLSGIVSKVKTNANNLIKNDIGNNKQFSYIVKINNIKISELAPNVIEQEANGEFGWGSSSSSNPSSPKAKNRKISFSVEAVVKEKVKDKVVERKCTSSYNYELQWEKMNMAEKEVGMDVWRNIYFPYYIPNGIRYLSADEWMRKMWAIYDFSTNVEVFPFSDYKTSGAGTYEIGNRKGYLVDYTDGSSLEFTGSNKIHSKLKANGSFLFRNGVHVSGGDTLEVKNLLALRNDKNKQKSNYIQDLNIIADVGTYVDINGQNSKMIVDETHGESFVTSNLLVNNTQDENAHNSANHGFQLVKGDLFVGKTGDAGALDFSNYLSASLKNNPQDSYWNEFINGSMIIASSNVYLGPARESDYSNKEEDAREMTIDGNFMLTSASLSSTSGEEGFSYYKDEGEFRLPNKPSTLTLDGVNSSFKVKNGLSYIDMPKTERKPSKSELNGKTYENKEFDSGPNFWNTIEIKNGATADLGLLGVEKFHLIVSDNSIFSCSILPKLELFDTDFLKDCYKNNNLEGKIILKPSSSGDDDDLLTMLDLSGVPAKKISSENNAVDGYVNIVEVLGGNKKGETEVITRKFDYSDAVQY
ncbi:MAG: hypothetical protein LBM95_08380 [Lactobacillales bacterium]|jgi:hypothetical protein|nr:hypothetical protein [Lactobacillales bacterium]